MRNHTDDDDIFSDFKIVSDTPHYSQPNAAQTETPSVLEAEKDEESDEMPPLSTELVFELAAKLNSDDKAESDDAAKQIIEALKANRVLLFSNEVAETYAKAYRNNRDVYIPALQTMSATFDGLALLDNETEIVVEFYKKHQSKINKMDGIGDVVTFLPSIAFDKLTKQTFAALKKLIRYGFDRNVFFSHRWTDFIEVFEEEGIDVQHFVRLISLLGTIQNTEKPQQNGN